VSIELKAPVTELYCDTVQGEGQSIGKLCSFIRFTGCIRTCSWCDSAHTWKKGMIQSTKMSVDKIVCFLAEGNARHLIITGGEPMMHQDKAYFTDMIKNLSTLGFTFEIETEGSFVPNSILTQLWSAGKLQINCSPKLKSAGMGDLSDDYAKPVLPVLAQRVTLSDNLAKPPTDMVSSLSVLYGYGAIFKFVVADDADAIEAFSLLKKAIPNVDWSDLRKRVYFMPLGERRQEQLDTMNQILDMSIQYGVNFSPRLHILRWDNKKGV